MATFRLLNISTVSIEQYALDNHPPYIAASHTWSENVFDLQQDFHNTFGGKGIIKATERLYPQILHCWIDTGCIDQNDDQDKLTQIPLMGEIFGGAAAVLIFISDHFGANQSEVDALAAQLQGALAMSKDDAWVEEGSYWQSGEGRKLIVQGMKGLLRLASTAWATRIWTLQEYVLAKTIVWIGLDLEPLKFDDFLLSALPDICNTLNITECLGPEMRVLFGHFEGMANVRLGSNDRTRIMELLGNRQATVAVDEVYGVMAASGFEVGVVLGETKFEAWRRWCEEAVRQGHMRWLLLPKGLQHWDKSEVRSCVFPCFAERHKLSASSSLDRVDPLGATIVQGGGAIVHARRVGRARIVRPLGTVHEAQNGRLHRDITLMMFAGAKWKQALQLVSVFGGGRYNFRQAKAIARVLTRSYVQAVQAVIQGREEDFRPIVSTSFQAYVWNDFMSLQQSQMIGLKGGQGYLCRVVSDTGAYEITTVLVTGDEEPKGHLEVLDLEAKSPDGRYVLMAVAPNGGNSVHKVGMMLPVSDDVAKLWCHIPLSKYEIGGERCAFCTTTNESTHGRVIRKDSKLPYSKEARSETLRSIKVVQRNIMALERRQQLSKSILQSKSPNRRHHRTASKGQRRLSLSVANAEAKISQLRSSIRANSR